MHEFAQIIVGFIALALLAGVISAVAVVENDKHNQVLALQEREKHCKMVWGDTEYFDACMRGEKIVPRSGMIN